MSSKMRWRYGDTNPVVAAVDANTVIEVGDLVFQDVDNAKPASAAVARYGAEDPDGVGEFFSDNFLGVAMQAHEAGQAGVIRVATTGVFEFDSDGDPYELGDLVGPMWDNCETSLCDQKVASADDEARYAVGRIARRAGAGSTAVLVDIRSTVMTGGVMDRCFCC